MKRLTFLTTLLINCIAAHAQTDSVCVWNKWCSRKDTALLFTAANNTIAVYSPTLKPADIKLKSLDVSLRIGGPEVKGDTTFVMAMPYPAKGKKMRMAVIYKKTGKTIRTIEFTSDNVPAPIAQLGNIKKNEAARKDILAQLSFKAVFPNSLYSYPYAIKQYTFKIAHEKGSATIPVNGFMVTKDVLQQIKDAPAGTVAEFTGIKATCPECATRTLEDLKIKIR
jgi:GldM C-terminal domain